MFVISSTPRVRNRDDPWVIVTRLNPRGRSSVEVLSWKTHYNQAHPQLKCSRRFSWSWPCSRFNRLWRGSRRSRRG
uniref:Uncharacterized protein n=1 Tax=Brassica oleracea TaxID=3712 RepID=A0A3P6E9I4_BRAOL|nr:unnamed protein product [Brassica oleracea]